LPDGRIFGQITQKEAPKNCSRPEKIGGRKMAKIGKSGRKEAGKYFYDYLDEKPYNYW
jgi:hypothetical protein